jgi:hypothetical protein
MRRLTIAALAAAALTAIACGVGAPDQAVPDEGVRPTVDATASPAPGDLGKAVGGTVPKGNPKPPAKTASFGEGTFEVGTDIKPGKYRTTVPADALICYWARLKDLDGELGSIRANGNLRPGGKGLVVVKKSDAAVEFRGDCTWTAVK